MKLRLHRFTPLTKSEGPGLRACIQVQGCPIKCAGCGVPQTWSLKGGALVDTDALIDTILSGPPIEGVSFLGGEPFAQAEAVFDVAEGVRAEGLSVVTFTGYTRETLEAAKRPDFDCLLGATDLLIDGPFERELLDLSRPWTGSSNQRFHFLTDRYAHLSQELSSLSNRLEIKIGPEGSITTGGLAPPHLTNALLAAVAKSLG